MIRVDDEIYRNGSQNRRKEKKGSYLNSIEKEISFLEHKKELKEAMWTSRIKEALIQCPADDMIQVRKSMEEQKEEDLKRIQEDLDFWTKELKQERNRPQKQHHLLKRKVKKRTNVQAERMILGYINHVIENPKYSAIATGPAVTKEEAAYALELPVNQIENIFRKLNREGILSQRIPRYAHDTNRNPIFYGKDSGWASDYYQIFTKSDAEKN